MHSAKLQILPAKYFFKLSSLRISFPKVKFVKVRETNFAFPPDTTLLFSYI